jgi:phosphoglycolate phosphatase
VQRSTAIFDFDGTLANSLDIVIDEYNQLAPRFRVKPIDRADLTRLRTLGGRAALREHNVSFWKVPFLTFAMRRALQRRVAEVQPIAGVPEALRALQEQDYPCSILSTNSSANIRRFLASQQLAMFTHVVGSASMFGKAGALKKLVRKQRLDPARTYYVGDEVRDIAAAKAAGVRSIAVTWGYAQRDALVARSPDHVVDTPAELVELLTPRR